MLSSHPGASPNKGSALSQAVAMLATICGIAAAIFLTPLMYGISKPSLLLFLTKAWGPDLAPMLTFLMGVAECGAIYVATKLTVVSIATWALMSLTRRFI